MRTKTTKQEKQNKKNTTRKREVVGVGSSGNNKKQ